MTSTSPTSAPDQTLEHPVDVVVIGGGGSAEALARALNRSGLRVVVIERHRVGGECPFVACIPSKAMLHDAARRTRWADAVQRRDDMVDQLDDSGHAQSLADEGAVLVRGDATIVDEHTVEVDGRRLTAQHLVIATGTSPIIPPIDGLDSLGDRLWTSDEALTTADRPTRVMIIGGGPIGCELAHIFAGFDTEVHLLDTADSAFPDLPPAIGEIVDDGLRAAGVRVCRGRSVVRLERRGGNVLSELDNNTSVITERVVIAAGRRPRTDGLGLEHIGLDPDEPLPVDQCGRVDTPGSVWAIGDVAGHGQYTHLANHQAAVVANQIAGDGSRRFDDVVLPACIFTRPPVMIVGPLPGELDDGDVVWAEAKLSESARWSTDDLGDGHLSIAVDRRTRRVVAAHGAGARFDELAAALITAIDSGVTVDRLAMSMWPFPTVSSMLEPIYEKAVAALDGTD